MKVINLWSRGQRKPLLLSIGLLVCMFVGCAANKRQAAQKPIKFTFVQFNDVYEIGTLEGGTVGGLARVATVCKQLKAQNPNTRVILAGDFLSPSVFGNVEWNGRKIKGAQMVDVLNQVGVDLVTFGNHEFDISESDLQSRIDSSAFTWVSSNVLHKKNDGTLTPFAKHTQQSTPKYFPKAIVETFKHSNAKQSVRVGFFGVTLDATRPNHVSYQPTQARAQYYYDSLRKVSDCVIAITHQNLSEDLALAKALPELTLIMGGHEHNNMLHKVGNTFITKADANAKTIYIHHLEWDGKKCTVRPELKKITAQIPEDAKVAQVVKKWKERAYSGFEKSGFQPDEKLATFTTSHDGLESSIRSQQTNLGLLIAQAMRAASPNTQAAFYNSGSVRIDDKIVGTVTQYDILRSLPFGGKVISVRMKGALVLQMLDASLKNTGSGGYLQLENIVFDKANNQWLLDNAPIEPEKEYNIATTEFLFSGAEKNMGFFTEKNENVISVEAPTTPTDARQDIRMVVIDYLRKNKRNY